MDGTSELVPRRVRRASDVGQRSIVLVFVALTLLAGCASNRATTTAAPGTAPPTSVVAGDTGTTNPSGPAANVSRPASSPGSTPPADTADPCSVLTHDMAESSLGVPVASSPRTFTNGPSNSCIWSGSSNPRAKLQLTLF